MADEEMHGGTQRVERRSAELPSIMSGPPVEVAVGSSLADAARQMLDARTGCVLVSEGGNQAGSLVGILTNDNFQPHEKHLPFTAGVKAQHVFGELIGDSATLIDAYRSHREIPVEQVMSAPLITVDADGTLLDAVKLMIAHEIKRVPVVDAGRAVGILTQHDLLKLMLV